MPQIINNSSTSEDYSGGGVGGNSSEFTNSVLQETIVHFIEAFLVEIRTIDIIWALFLTILGLLALIALLECINTACIDKSRRKYKHYYQELQKNGGHL